MKGTLVRLLGCGLAGALFVTAPATAHVQTKLDPDDTAGPVDVVAARHSHRRAGAEREGHSSRFRLVAYETWTYQDIEGDERFLAFEIDLDGDDVAERCLVVQAEVGEESALGYSATVFEGCDYVDDEIVASYGTGRVSVPDSHSLTVSVPAAKLLGRGVRVYRWRALTSYEDEDSEVCGPNEHDTPGGYGVCTDFTAWKRHRL